jgi:ribosomal protein S14
MSLREQEAYWKKRTEAGRKASLEVCLDYTKDPCRRCGKYPLSIYNSTGLCRKCSRSMHSEARHVGR